MKRTEIPAAKCYAARHDKQNALSPATTMTLKRLVADPIPCILRTAAADKLILDVVRAAKKWQQSDDGADLYRFHAAVQRLEKAGVKL